MNKKVIVMFVISAFLLIVGIGSLVFNNKIVKPEEDSPKSKQLTTVMYNLLIWGEEIYSSGEYKSYQKDNSSFISVKELEEIYHYDISSFTEKNCDIENTGITQVRVRKIVNNFIISPRGDRD